MSRHESDHPDHDHDDSEASEGSEIFGSGSPGSELEVRHATVACSMERPHESC